MSFIAPVWNASEGHYVIEMSNLFKNTTAMQISICKDNNGSTTFDDMDTLHNVTDNVIHRLISEGDKNKWFSKLPSHEQLMKRVSHSFATLASESHNSSVLQKIFMTPKSLTFVWLPVKVAESSPPPLYIDDSETEGEEEIELAESNLPPVALTDSSQETQEEYLLTRLRAAKARVEAEQIRMQYFEATGRMPPDSDSESESEDN
jgi:hypothetical protein